MNEFSLNHPYCPPGSRYFHVYANGRHRILRRQKCPQGQPPRHPGRRSTHRFSRGPPSLGEDLRENAARRPQQRAHQDLDRRVGQGPRAALQSRSHERHRV